ncbi:MAG: hypothetical protein B7Z73_12975 [Planctomycetia bacterium 21-64-5]|nr:MAG: hypothetical protein B7Z73_12975 [Planctomycetia bacterium 21-64-5]
MTRHNRTTAAAPEFGGPIHRRQSMQAYILETGRRVSPFDEPVGEMPVHNRRLRDHQQSILEDLGCQVETIDDLRQARRQPCLLVYDDVYFTYHAAQRFLAVARRRNEAARREGRKGRGNFAAALPVSPLTQRFVPSFQGRTVQQPDGTSVHAYDLYFLSDWDTATPAGDQTEPIGIPHYVNVRRWRVNRHFDASGSYSLPMSTVALCPVQHWSSLLPANILGIPSFVLQSAKKAAYRTATLPLRIVWRAGSLWPSRLRSKTYLAGPGCKVHPTAHVEWSVLGRGVRIGPNAVVRGAVLGDRVEIGPGALVELSTLGEKATVNANVTVRSCVVGEEGHIGAYFTQGAGRGDVSGQRHLRHQSPRQHQRQLRGSHGELRRPLAGRLPGARRAFGRRCTDGQRPGDAQWLHAGEAPPRDRGRSQPELARERGARRPRPAAKTA